MQTLAAGQYTRTFIPFPDHLKTESHQRSIAYHRPYLYIDDTCATESGALLRNLTPLDSSSGEWLSALPIPLNWTYTASENLLVRYSPDKDMEVLVTDITTGNTVRRIPNDYYHCGCPPEKHRPIWKFSFDGAHLFALRYRSVTAIDVEDGKWRH